MQMLAILLCISLVFQGIAQFWQHHNQPIEIHSNKFFDERLDYIHQNPVVSRFVSEAPTIAQASTLVLFSF